MITSYTFDRITGWKFVEMKKVEEIKRHEMGKNISNIIEAQKFDIFFLPRKI